MMMTPEALKSALSALQLSQVDAAKLLGKNGRTMRRWVKDGIQNDPASAIMLKLLVKGAVTVQDIENLKAEEAA